jgi:hypothetical protein
MRQAKLTPEQQELDKAKYPEMFKERLAHYAGFMYSSQPFTTYSHTPEEREAFFEELWQMVVARHFLHYQALALVRILC